ncbi:MAG: D-Ala-D-Ala carboxypeptidase family metallohydrolase [Pseudomonadota bacterium]
MHMTVSRALKALRARCTVALALVVACMTVATGTPSQAALPTELTLEAAQTALMKQDQSIEERRYRVQRSMKRYISVSGTRTNETQELTRYAAVARSPYNSGRYWYGPKAKWNKKATSKKRKASKKKYSKKKKYTKRKYKKKKKYAKKKKYSKKRKYSKKTKYKKKKYTAKRSKTKKTYAAKSKKAYVAKAKKIPAASRPKVQYDTAVKTKKQKKVKVAALGRQSYDVAPSKKKSLTGGGVRWVASSGCLTPSLRSKIYSVAANYGRVTVNSTCRSKARNRRVGGASRSQHLTGNAVDFRVHGNWRAAAAYLRGHSGGYKHYGGGLFHIDGGARRRW